MRLIIFVLLGSVVAWVALTLLLAWWFRQHKAKAAAATFLTLLCAWMALANLVGYYGYSATVVLPPGVPTEAVGPILAEVRSEASLARLMQQHQLDSRLSIQEGAAMIDVSAPSGPFDRYRW